MKIIKKLLSIVIVFVLLFERTIFFVLAQEVSPSPEASTIETETSSPSPTPSESPSPSPVALASEANVQNNVDSGAVSGDNEVEVVTPSPTPSESPTSIEAASSSPADSVSDPSSTLPPVSHENGDPSPTSTPVSSGSSVETQDAASLTVVENNVNTNIVNSKVIHHVLNIYLPDETGDIDLTQVAGNAIRMVFESDQRNERELSVQMLSVDNFAYVENNINSQAITGANTVEGGGESDISTGNAYSVISVFNNVNTNIIDSEIHLVTINIFGNFQGNIILPEYSDLRGGECCGASISIKNGALVENNISSQAVTGENKAIVTDEGDIATGDAASSVEIYNLINASLVNVYFGTLQINTFGEWNGSFLGWMQFLPSSSSNISLDSNSATSQGNENCSECSTDDLQIENNAVVKNNISSLALTGRNYLSSAFARLITGNAFSSISLINLINTNIIGSKGFFGFINIFGKMTGDIGGGKQIY